MYMRVTQSKMAEIVGMSPRGWQQIERGDAIPSGQTLMKLAELGFDPTWILTGQGAMRLVKGASAQELSEPSTPFEGASKPFESFSETDFALIPKVDVQASAGGGAAPTSESVLEYLAFRKDWLRQLGLNPKKVAVLTAKGDSMEPTIGNGNVLLVDRQVEQVTNDGIYVLSVNNNLFVKRLYTRMDGSVVIKSDNPAYPDETFPYEAAGDLAVIGRVCWIAKTM